MPATDDDAPTVDQPTLTAEVDDAGDHDAPEALPSMRASAHDSPGHPFSSDDLAHGPIRLRDALLECPVAEILGLDGPRSREVVNEAWRHRRQQIEDTWPDDLADPGIRAGRADLLRLLNSTMRALTVPLELRRWQAREAELGRPAVYSDLFEFTATTIATTLTTMDDVNARIEALTRDERLVERRVPERAVGSTEGLDPAVIAAGFTNEMLDAAGKKKPAVSIADQRHAAEQKRLKAYGIVLLVAAFLVFLSWTNACPQDLPS